jgi:hypothetical protein
MKPRHAESMITTNQRCVCLSIENKRTGDVEMMTVWENEISAEVDSFALRNFVRVEDINVAMLNVSSWFSRDSRSMLGAGR